MNGQDYQLVERGVKALEKISMEMERISDAILNDEGNSIVDSLDEIAACATLIRNSHFFYSSGDSTFSIGETVCNKLDNIVDAIKSVEVCHESNE